MTFEEEIIGCADCARYYCSLCLDPLTIGLT